MIDRKQYMKNYLKKYCSEIILCACGKQLRKVFLKQHLNTERHKLLMKLKEFENTFKSKK